ncbi:MAG: PIN domain-containing protein [Acidobacteria bacterium]|nr:PIN domain-containing protein [Acidobacteriota bacterium]
MIFVDTSAVFALAGTRDLKHRAARQRFDALLRTRRRLLTHSYVLSESMALLHRRLGAEAALVYASEARAFEVEWVDESLHDAAVAALRTAPRKVSLVDQVSFS